MNSRVSSEELKSIETESRDRTSDIAGNNASHNSNDGGQCGAGKGSGLPRGAFQWRCPCLMVAS